VARRGGRIDDVSERHDTEIEREERAIYLIMLAAMAPVVIGLAIDRRTIDGGAALSLILVALGVIGLLAGLRTILRRRLPRARARFRRR
jgi:hypothetical protein